jgi:hypothetical protein
MPKDAGDDLVQWGGGVHFQVRAVAQQRLDILFQQQGPGELVRVHAKGLLVRVASRLAITAAGAVSSTTSSNCA